MSIHTSIPLQDVVAQKPRVELDPQRKIKLQRAVRDFEAMFLNQMLKSMRSTVQQSGLFGEENFGGDVVNSMFDMELSSKLAQSRGFGIGDMLYYKITGEHLPTTITASSQSSEMNSVSPKRNVSKEVQEFTPINAAPRPLPGEAKTLRERVEQYNDIIDEAAKKYSLDSNLIKAVIATESRGNMNARSPKDAKGVMQLIDSTAAEMGVKDVWNPSDNIMGGAKYLKLMLDNFDGDIEKALASYNAGPGSVMKHKGIPPYKETQQYVKRTMNYMKYFQIPE
ncbi:MAG: murein transglycosylase [Ignavibacteria bacterium]|nr:murein transglycosylase [Ignavibacteria bacterium]